MPADPGQARNQGTCSRTTSSMGTSSSQGASPYRITWTTAFGFTGRYLGTFLSLSGNRWISIAKSMGTHMDRKAGKPGSHHHAFCRRSAPAQEGCRRKALLAASCPCCCTGSKSSTSDGPGSIACVLLKFAAGACPGTGFVAWRRPRSDLIDNSAGAPAQTRVSADLSRQTSISDPQMITACICTCSMRRAGRLS